MQNLKFPSSCGKRYSSSRSESPTFIRRARNGSVLDCIEVTCKKNKSLAVAEMSLLQARLALLLTSAEGEEEQNILCADCDAETSTVEDLETHVAADHLLWVRFQCALCPRVKFPSRKNGIDHFALKHPSSSIQLTENIDFAKEKELVNSLCRAFRQQKSETAQSCEIETSLVKEIESKDAVTSQAVIGAAETIETAANDSKRLRPRSSLRIKRLAEDLSNDDDETPVKSKKQCPSAGPCRVCDQNVHINRRKHVLSHINIEVYHYHCSVCDLMGPSWEQIRGHIRSSHPDDAGAKPIADSVPDVDVIYKQWIACFGAVPLQYG